MTILKQKLVAIRKKQTCFGCARKFKEGTFLKYHASTDMGKIASVYWCPVCEEYIDKYSLYEDIVFGELKSGDHESWEEMRKQVEGDVDLSIPEEVSRSEK